MKRLILMCMALPLIAPSLGQAETGGTVNLGLRANDFDDESARFDQYRDKSDGLFGSADIRFDNETSFVEGSIMNPGLDDQSYSVAGGVFGLFKGDVYYDELTHNLSYDALSPAAGIGGDTLFVPNPVPPVSAWTPFDYYVDVERTGGNITVDTRNPFYFKASFDRQTKDGRISRGMYDGRVFFLAMPIDYTTYTTTLETGYRSKETTAALYAGYSDFENENEVLTLIDQGSLNEYSDPSDNHAYNIGGRLTQRLPMNSLLAVKGAFNQHKSETDFYKYLTSASPTADGEFDGDVRYWRASAVLSSQWNSALDTRLSYNYVNRNNQSDLIEVDGVNNHLFEYDQHRAGLDADYRLDRDNKLTGGYEFTGTDRQGTRPDADTTYDNMVFAQLKNSTIDWMTAKLRLEYLNRDSDSDYAPEDLEGDALIREYFTPFDYASKDRYKAKVSFDMVPMEKLTLGLSYALVYDDYDASQLGLQKEKHHEFYADAGFQLPAKMKLNTYIGYEYTESDFDSRRYNPGFPNPALPTTSLNYNWSEEYSYDFFVVGGRMTIPVIARLELELNADYQMVDGNIDFARSAAAGAPLETIDKADDYYKTEAGIKGRYRFDDHWSTTLGYAYEKSNLDDWRYDNYTYQTGSLYLSGAGLDRDYEVHQVYLLASYSF